MSHCEAYAVEHSYCTFESDFALVSLHLTLEGAYKAKRAHKENAFNEERDLRLKYGIYDPHPCDYLWLQDWRIRKVVIGP